MRVKLEDMVLRLLGEHSCVTVPGLGAFIYRESPAASNTFTYEIRPAVRTVFFNSAISDDDGLLANQLRQSHGITFAEAQAMVSKAVAELRSTLETNRNLHFGKLGNFFLNGENQTFFFPSPSLNLSHQTFGLPIIKLEELEKAKVVETPVTTKPAEEKMSIPLVMETEEYEEAKVVHIEEKEQKNRSWIWKVAASVAILTLAGTGYYFGRQLFKSKNTELQQASVDTPVLDSESNSETIYPKDTAFTGSTAPVEEAPVVVAPEQTPVETQTAPEIAVTEKVEPAVTQPVGSVDLNPMEELQSAKGNYYVVAGKYIDENLANMECKQWEKKNIRAAVYKAENSSLYKVILKRFASMDEANAFASSISATGTNISVKEIKNFK